MTEANTDTGVADAFIAYRQAIDRWRQGEHEPAVAELEAVLEGRRGELSDQLLPRVARRLLVFAARGGWPQKERLARRVIELMPGDPLGHHHLGEALLRQDRIEEAETELQTAIALDPEAEDSRLLLMMARKRVAVPDASRKRAKPWPDRQQLFEDPRRMIERYLLRGYPTQKIVRPDTVFMTLGSCFADNLARRLAAAGYEVNSESIGEEVNSTYANRYLLRWVEQGPVDAPTQVIDEIYGPVRRERLRQSIIASDIFVLTLGVASSFFDRQTGEFAFSTVQSATGWQYLVQNCEMRTTTVAENVANILEILASIERISGRTPKVVMSVSPVSLGGTTEPYSAVIADCLSKSTLRLACQEVITARPGTIYWPSFEIVRWLGVHYTRPERPVFGAEDGSTRHVSTWLVDLIVGLFVEHHSA
jgi:hypothetical protein